MFAADSVTSFAMSPIHYLRLFGPEWGSAGLLNYEVTIFIT